MTTRQPILLTGGTGQVAQLLADGLRRDYRLRRADLHPPAPGDTADDTFLIGDLTDPERLTAALDGVETVVHLAADPNPSDTWDQLAGPNTQLVARLLAAARERHIRRVVLASSIHAAGGYERSEATPVSPAWPTNPCCMYGATKAFAEAAGRVYARDDAMSVVCLRLGYVRATPHGASKPQDWLSQPDLEQLVRCALTADVGYGVYFGISANAGLEWDLGNAERELDYHPTSDASRQFGLVG